VYGEDAFVPLARLDHVAGADGEARAEVRHLHTDHLGTPRELTDSDGRVVWAARYRAWGNVLEVVQEEVPAILPSDEIGEAQPVRFQGSTTMMRAGCITTGSVTMIRILGGLFRLIQSDLAAVQIHIVTHQTPLVGLIHSGSVPALVELFLAGTRQPRFRLTLPMCIGMIRHSRTTRSEIFVGLNDI
jgi:hypothetical protein